MENKKKIVLPIKVIIIGCIIGLVVALIGVVKQINASKTNETRKNEAYKQSQENVAAAKKRVAEIKTEIANLQQEYEAKQQECDSMNMSDDNWFTENSKCQREASSIDYQIDQLEIEQTKLENADYTVYYSLVKPMSYQIFYIIGGAIAGLSVLGAFIIYLVKGKKTY